MPINPPSKETDTVTKVQLITAIFWPSFLVAGVMTTIVFALIDPLVLSAGISRSGIYTIGFLFFWTGLIAATAGTAYYLQPIPPRKLDSDDDLGALL